MKDNKTDEKMYVVYCHTTPDGMQYFGMSGNVKQRWRQSVYKGCSLEPYIEQFGWGAITHEVLYENLTRDKALEIEDSLIVEARKRGTCLNMRRSGHHNQTEEYNDWKLEYDKEYYQSNKEKIKTRMREYRKRKKDNGDNK